MGIAIVHPDDPNRPKVIPAERYDAARHVLWDAPEEKPQEPAEAPSELPEGFPAREQLHDAGVTTVHGVRAIYDLTEIPGIGETRASEVIHYLADLEE